jgi:hypothetical protein
MAALAKLAEQITEEFPHISPAPYVTSTLDYVILSVVGTLSIFLTLKFF